MKTIQNYCKMPPLKEEDLIYPLPERFASGGYHPPGFQEGGTSSMNVYNTQIYRYIDMYIVIRWTN